MKRSISFAAKVLLAIFVVVVALRLIGLLVSHSRWTAFEVVVVIAVIAYLTAHRWVDWLPGLLIFGVVNAIIGFVTHHSPTNPGVAVSREVAGLLVAFYAVGSVITYYYDARRLFVADRLAILLYLFCMVLPAFSENNLAAMTPIVGWSTSIGIAVLIASFVSHRARLGKYLSEESTV
jgi:hypothetical protein